LVKAALSAHCTSQVRCCIYSTTPICKCNRWRRWTLYLQSLLFRQVVNVNNQRGRPLAKLLAASLLLILLSWEHVLLVFWPHDNPPYVWVWLSDPGRIEQEILCTTVHVDQIRSTTQLVCARVCSCRASSVHLANLVCPKNVSFLVSHLTRSETASILIKYIKET
jgi:hypothetical protein